MTEPAGVLEVPDKLTVYVIDDDRDVRTMLSRMVQEAGNEQRFTAHPFASANDFLDGLEGLQAGCILLDLRMPEVDGFALMGRLNERNIGWPVVVMTGASDVQSAVQAMKLGALDYLEKPIRIEPLAATLGNAAATLGARVEASERRRLALEKLDALSGRESEVLEALISGLSNKEIAIELGIGLRTVEMHRGNMMDRLGASSLAEVVALALDAGLRPRERRLRA